MDTNQLNNVKNIVFGMLAGIIIPSILFKFDLYILVGAIIGGIIAMVIVRRRDRNIKPF